MRRAALRRDGGPFAEADLAPHYDRVEATLGVRERADWPKSVDGRARVPCARCASSSPSGVHRRELHALRLLPAGLSDERRQVHAEHVHPLGMGGRPARAQAELPRRARADRGSRSRPGGVGVEYRDAADELRRVDADVVVVAAARRTRRSSSSAPACRPPSTGIIGRNLGFHPARLVYGLFDEPQDAHMVYPITAHCMDYQHDEDGGFVVEATTIQDPIGFATTLATRRAALGPAARRGGARLPPLGRMLRWSTTTTTRIVVDDDGLRAVRPRLRRARARADRGGVRRSSARCSRRRARARLLAGLASTTAGRVPDGRATRTLGRRRPLRGVGGAAALCRRQLGDPAHPVRQPVAHDHGGRDRLAEHLDPDPTATWAARREDDMRAALLVSTTGRWSLSTIRPETAGPRTCSSGSAARASVPRTCTPWTARWSRPG